MPPEELLREWESGSTNGLRPARIQQLRGDLYRITGEPIPWSRSEIESWLEKKKGHITQLLRQAVEEEIRPEDID